MFIWAYVHTLKDNKFTATSKMCIRYDDVLYAESLKSDPPGTLWLVLRTGGAHLVKVSHREYLEHFKVNTPLLLAPLEPVSEVKA